MRSKKSIEIRKKLINKGIELIYKEGIEKISLRRIARECGFAPYKSYYHFKDTQEFLQEVKHVAIRQLMERVNSERILGEKNPLERLVLLEKEYMSFYRKYSRLVSQLRSKTSLTQYYIEEDGRAWQYVLDYPYLMNEGKKNNNDINCYKRILMGALIDGMPYALREESLSDEKIRALFQTELLCFDDALRVKE